MSYRYVQAKYDSYGNRTATKALVVHMTEGSGTEADVDYLANNPLRGVSVHFVIVKTGEIVQMLGWNRIAGSINPNELRTTDDPPYTSPDGARVVYGATLRDAIMGSWINGGLLAVEVGGKAVDGPNQAQSEALVRLLADVRTRYPSLPVLGHRDFTSTKGCPGHKVLWASLGGHGKPAAPEDPVQRFLVPEGPQQLATLKDGTWLYVYSDLRTDPANVQVNPGRTFPYVGKHSSTPDVRSVAYEPATADDNLSSWAMFVRREDITTIGAPAGPGAAGPDAHQAGHGHRLPRRQGAQRARGPPGMSEHGKRQNNKPWKRIYGVDRKYTARVDRVRDRAEASAVEFDRLLAEASKPA
jgi:hypothetical protein